MTKVKLIQGELRALASHELAALQLRFFKTGPGQYGEGDIFLGIKVPPLRSLSKRHSDADLGTIASLIESKFHEERFFALLLLMQLYKHGSEQDRTAAYEMYLGNTRHINNWDLVDVSAPHIVGPYLENRSRKILHEMACSDSMWERRIAILATFHFIRLNDFEDCLRITKTLLNDKQDLMHKAAGWMLREIGKRDIVAEEDFLQEHYRKMPRTMLRYAIERLPEIRRKEYLLGHA